MLKLYLNTLWKSIAITAVLVILVLLTSLKTYAQCPQNIDFEDGTFTGWQCYSYDGYTGGPIPALTLTTPTPGRHDIITAATMPTRDPYGNFAELCPNGSTTSVRIGRTASPGQSIDRISYTFTIPANQSTFTLIYHYALVLNDGGSNHNSTNQPRFIIETKDITNGTPLPCQLDEINVGSNLPGFFVSPNPAPNGSLVRCKNWAAGSLNLDGYGGRTIQISFTVTGCGLTNGSHFGYAYIDVNSECGSGFEDRKSVV